MTAGAVHAHHFIHPFYKVPTMRRHQPTRRDLKAFEQALQAASQGPRVTPDYLAELAAKRDQYLAKLAS